MKQYLNAEELIESINESYKKFIEEFKGIPEELRDKHITEVDKSPSEMLSYQLGWINLLLSWEKDEQCGLNVKTPTPAYKWNNLGGLYKSFYEQYGFLTLKQQEEELTKLICKLIEWINNLSEAELFQPEQRKWATTKAMWPVWKWVHINTVAPFTNFRTKIRKWKKIVL
ncbi:ClbS/DfsB family four-helix bundle protein [Virgibacillus proomii]|uniref:ClbS/DfsB family four-helix bundle protein n=1 Tax=Virgibacillus proomii TaxID=84407 RepID=UPI001C11D081|nr:ClbS/DfsB family four-helix bundle protein [Virgibacillus proomii]MBU5267097.1 ClbS/DfsB family four-helix bundle protein [Virgibacillus proomii]